MKKGIDDKVKSIIDEEFEVTDIKYVPDIDNTSLTFGNKGLRFEATTLFIDMRGSTKVLNSHNRTTVAKLHKAYFHTIVTIAKSLGGEVRSFNGDGMLVFFQGTSKVTLSNAVEAAMKMKWMLSSSDSLVKTKMEKYSTVDFGIGIDDGKILCAKVGISGVNNRDLVWIGNAVNKAVKIGDKLEGKVGISSYVYSNLLDRVKYAKGKDFLGNEIDVNMWEEDEFTYNGKTHTYYTTTYYWKVV
ncbi:adenylate/guanylate cyclase domain-containing protein [Vibrio cholerae]|uniref:adenylate/guanylate cyclase domain-containing protein n=1 Tax=Vibrio cholerae TaxID=666 RepID=UPI000E0A4454|nr:adenylate/guanylate cyclase domain-containing protein [Vibrio cholerae]EJS1626636.1 adenylate/guanylate cyclase domain-containing protein [Vibrio cholerae]HDI3186134.1 adenylate/guanylate cyclase domain-containing protein [Vibrio cholerae]